ncbi:MAG: hypothetical protein V4581_17145 [Bacteroidota bacterium]
MKKLLLLLTLIIIYSCDNGTATHGTNPQNINGFIDLTTFKPTAVEYNLDRSNEGRMGPSDYTVEAVLYYDAATFARFREQYGKDVANDAQITKSTFNYKWLPKAVKDELAASPEAYVYRTEPFTRHGNHYCFVWFLNNKVLVYYFTM